MSKERETEYEIGYELEELLPLVAELTNQYTGYESTSITYEKAQQLMEAVIYCIKEWEQEGENGLRTGQTGAREAYKLGYGKILERLDETRKRYNLLIESFEDYGNECLRDTVKEIPQFFIWYDPKFAPQDTILTLDYPVLWDISGDCGIVKIDKFITCLEQEQQFLRRFPRPVVIEMLELYSNEYEELVENLCSMVMSAARKGR